MAAVGDVAVLEKKKCVIIISYEKYVRALWLWFVVAHNRLEIVSFFYLIYRWNETISCVRAPVYPLHILLITLINS